MCEENKTYILDLLFSNNNDTFNWSKNTNNPININDGVLIFNQQNQNERYSRKLGVFLSSKNRVRIKSNFVFSKKNVLTSDNIKILVQVVSKEIIYDELLELELGEIGIEYNYFFDRVINYEFSSDEECKIVFTFIDGYDNFFGLKNIKAINYNNCNDNLRTYFVIENLFKDSFTAISSAVKLKQLRVDDKETLTIDFFSDTNVVGVNAKEKWNFSKSNLDGSERVKEEINPNSFNFLESEFKLVFDESLGFKGGKAISTFNGRNYGAEILNFGVEKPCILNAELSNEKGAFFIDINYNKNLKIVFDVIVNIDSIEIYNKPNYIRTYFIEWDKNRCEKKFYYIENRKKVDQAKNGFLFGITK